MASVVPNPDSHLRSSERRRAVRLNLEALAYIELGTNNGGVILNLSEGGLALRAAIPVMSDHIPAVRFHLPQLSNVFEIECRITWKSEDRRAIGVSFVNPSDSARMQIAQWVRQQIPLPTSAASAFPGTPPNAYASPYAGAEQVRSAAPAAMPAASTTPAAAFASAAAASEPAMTEAPIAPAAEAFAQAQPETDFASAAPETHFGNAAPVMPVQPGAPIHVEEPSAAIVRESVSPFAAAPKPLTIPAAAANFPSAAMQMAAHNAPEEQSEAEASFTKRLRIPTSLYPLPRNPAAEKPKTPLMMPSHIVKERTPVYRPDPSGLKLVPPAAIVLDAARHAAAHAPAPVQPVAPPAVPVHLQHSTALPAQAAYTPTAGVLISVPQQLPAAPAQQAIVPVAHAEMQLAQQAATTANLRNAVVGPALRPDAGRRAAVVLAVKDADLKSAAWILVPGVIVLSVALVLAGWSVGRGSISAVRDVFSSDASGPAPGAGAKPSAAAESLQIQVEGADGRDRTIPWVRPEDGDAGSRAAQNARRQNASGGGAANSRNANGGANRAALNASSQPATKPAMTVIQGTPAAPFNSGAQPPELPANVNATNLQPRTGAGSSGRQNTNAVKTSIASTTTASKPAANSRTNAAPSGSGVFNDANLVDAPGQILRRTDPIYPQDAINAHIEGVVELEAIIMRDGSVRDVKVMSGDKKLAPAAVAAVKQWRFEPAVIDGKLVESKQDVRLTFRLGDQQ